MRIFWRMMHNTKGLKNRIKTCILLLPLNIGKVFFILLELYKNNKKGYPSLKNIKYNKTCNNVVVLGNGPSINKDKEKITGRLEYVLFLLTIYFHNI